MTDKAEQVLNFLASTPLHGNSVVDRAVAREILSKTDAQVMANGTLWDVITKHVGAGMYRVSLRAKP
jgi:hypothetical protein